MTNKAYNLYPFILRKQSQFVVQYPNDQDVRSQVQVYWLNSKDANHSFSMSMPLLYHNEKIVLRIIDETLNGSIIANKTFLTQTGFHFEAIRNHKYRIIVLNLGIINKIVQIAMSNKNIIQKELNQFNRIHLANLNYNFSNLTSNIVLK